MSVLLAVAFLILAGSCGLAAASGRFGAARVPILAAAPLLALVVWWQLGQQDGLPRHGLPPTGSSYVSAVVEEPTSSDPGHIYLWVLTPSGGAPRAYQVRYSRSLHEQIARAQAVLKHGEQVSVSRRPAADGMRMPRSGLRFYINPPAAAPRKDT
jgi:hypothetical protein